MNVTIILLLGFIIYFLFKNSNIEKFTQIPLPDGFSNVVVSNAIGDLQSVDLSYFLNPKGSIIAWTGNIAPNGWALCDGNNGTPDLRGRFILGYGTGNFAPGLTVRNLNDKGGEEKHTLSIGEMPAHNHANSNYQIPSPTLGDRKVDSGNKGANPNAQMGSMGILGNMISSDGGNQPHNIMPPFYVLAYIMKT